jgi:restriction system protein
VSRKKRLGEINMPLNEDPIELTPKQFEYEVKSIIEKTNVNLESFEAKHLEKLYSSEGVYEIDITVRFEALGVKYLTLIECKHQRNPIKREVVQVLYDRVRATGAHKGMLFATTTFQRGAIKYASVHGIALIRITEGKTFYVTKTIGISPEPPSWANISPYVGDFISLSNEGNIQHSLISVRYPDALNRFLFTSDVNNTN